MSPPKPLAALRSTLFGRTALAVAVLVLALLAGGPSASAAEDLRTKFGTSSLQAAQLLAKAMVLIEENRFKEAEPILDEALKADPACLMTHYWKADMQMRLGRVEQAVETYKQFIELADKNNVVTNVKVDGEVNLALTLCRMGRLEDAAVWYSRAILEDKDNGFKLRGKAWRNLGISLMQRKRGLAAYVALLNARADIPEQITDDAIREALKMAENEEAAHILAFPNEADLARPPAAREAPGAPVEEKLDKPFDDKVAWLLADPAGKYVLALGRGQKSYRLIATGEKLAPTALEAPGNVHAASLADGSLYLACGTPPELVQLEPATAKVVARWPLNGAPASIAACPRWGVVFCVLQRRVRGLDLAGRRWFDADLEADVVVSDTTGSLVYGCFKEDKVERPSPAAAAPGGESDSSQTLLWRAVVVGDGLVVSDLRSNAAVNGLQLGVSPDGRWVAVAGAGGWRPAGGGAGTGGNGVAVFNAGNLEKLAGYFATGPGPLGVAFNPVTGQLAAVREKEVRVYHVADPKSPVKLAGKFSGPAAWSADGAWLLLANSEGGIAAYRNPLTVAEAAAGTSWTKSLTRPFFCAGSARKADRFEPLPGFAGFQVARTEAAVHAALKAAIEARRTTKVPHWAGYEAYVKNPEVASVAAEAVKEYYTRDDAGIAIYKLRKALEKNPASPPLDYFLGEGLRRSGQLEEAEPLFQGVVRADAGRSDLTLLALQGLSLLYGKKKDTNAALYCLALALQADLADPGTHGMIGPVLEANPVFGEEARAVKAAADSRTGPGMDLLLGDSKLPELAKADPKAKVMDAADVYGQVADSVVLIVTPGATGSGFCVGTAEHILTNAHVVGNNEMVTVVPFVVRKNRAVKLPEVKGRVVFRAADADIAVIRLVTKVDTLEPLPVVGETPAVGSKVFAIGNPGMGDKILEQTMSEGIVSATGRKLGDQTYLQHTAAVNPGNSGGPLFNEKGQVVGMVTLKARLENVSFAIPVEVLRATLKSK